MIHLRPAARPRVANQKVVNMTNVNPATDRQIAYIKALTGPNAAPDRVLRSMTVAGASATIKALLAARGPAPVYAPVKGARPVSGWRSAAYGARYGARNVAANANAVIAQTPITRARLAAGARPAPIAARIARVDAPGAPLDDSAWLALAARR